MERSHEELKELLVPYALGAIPEDEMAEIRSHILSCEECMAEADGYAETAASLAVAAEPEALPAGFADRVVAKAREGRSTETVSAPARSRRWRVLEGLSFAALLLVVAVLGVAVVNARSDAALERRAVGALVSDEGMELTGLEGVAARMLPGDDGSVFVAQGLEETASDETYQLWLMRGECAVSDGDCTIVSAGTFEPDDDGIVIHEAAESLDGYDDAAVTIEPAGGSEQPTSDPLFSSL
ncbi:MAG TPA: anti-sigma factor [Actinomycetota bacterium]|jgi:anti-sigma-K factor RskA